MPNDRGNSLAHLRGERREQGSGDEPGRIVGVEPAGDAADALRRELTLCGQQDVAELVDDLPRRRDQPGERVAGVAGGPTASA